MNQRSYYLSRSCPGSVDLQPDSATGTRDATGSQLNPRLAGPFAESDNRVKAALLC